MHIKFFDPAKEFELHKEEYTKVWQDVRSRGDLILRKDVEQFEQAFAQYIGVKYAVGLNSGTDALLIALKALGIKEGDKVLVPSHTFVATAQVVNQIGAQPIIYDMGTKAEYQIIDMAVRYSVKCIMVAHIAGEFMLPNMKKLIDWANTEKIPVIEDACQALGATQEGKLAGSFGNTAAFSFYPAKILGGPGDAGALVTNDEKIYQFAQDYRNHWKSDYSLWGINSRLDNVIAAELNVKLTRIAETLKRREEIANKYRAELMTDIFLPNVGEGRVWQDFIINVGENRDKLYEFLKEQGIETMKNEYPMPIPKLSNAKKYEAKTLRLPINEVITDEEVDYVISKLKEFYA